MKKQSYHHGNLREALLNVACELLEAKLSLRKCAEKVGVSHTAFKNHFSNIAGLLTAIVTCGYSKLAKMMTTNINDESSRGHRRQEALTGYIKFAEFNPALYELMFSKIASLMMTQFCLLRLENVLIYWSMCQRS